MSTKFRENITTRYGYRDKDIYQQVMNLVKENNIAKSKAQLLLVKRGLQHTQNPEPLVKEKIVYRDRLVYKDRPIEKVVYRDKPDEHIRDIPDEKEHLVGIPKSRDDPRKQTHSEGNSKSEQLPSAGKLKTRDKASSPLNVNALEEKKPATHNGALTWIGGITVGSLVVYGLIRWLAR